jgi:hypothetical protein
MKHKYSMLGATLLAIGTANATIAFSTTTAVALKDNGAVTSIASGALCMLVVDTTSILDTASNGFLATSTNGRIPALSYGTAALTTTSDPKVLAANAAITVGSYFGGDLILGVFSAAGGGSVSAALSGVSIAGYEGKQFALVWFKDSAATLASSRAGAYFGIASGADWTLPASDSGAYTFNATTNTTTSVYWQLASATTAAQIGSTGFFTGSGTAGSTPSKAAVFQVVPEPSAALLGALGVLGLLRRRRN